MFCNYFPRRKLDLYFHSHMFLILINTNLLIFFYFVLLLLNLRNFFLIPYHKVVLLCSNCILAFGFSFNTMIKYELVFVCCAKYGCTFTFLHKITNFSSTICWKDYTSLQWIAFVPWTRIILPWILSLFPDSILLIKSMSIFSPIPCCLENCRFIGLEFRQFWLGKCILFVTCFGYSNLWHFY